MKASYRWIRSLVPRLTATAAELAARFTAAGLEVEAVHEYGAATASCVIAEVVKRRAHPTKSALGLVTRSATTKSWPQQICVRHELSTRR